MEDQKNGMFNIVNLNGSILWLSNRLIWDILQTGITHKNCKYLLWEIDGQQSYYSLQLVLETSVS